MEFGTRLRSLEHRKSLCPFVFCKRTRPWIPRVTTFFHRRLTPPVSWSTPRRHLRRMFRHDNGCRCPSQPTDCQDAAPAVPFPQIRNLRFPSGPPHASRCVRCEAPGCIPSLSSTRLSSPGCFLCGTYDCYFFPSSPARYGPRPAPAAGDMLLLAIIAGDGGNVKGRRGFCASGCWPGAVSEAVPGTVPGAASKAVPGAASEAVPGAAQEPPRSCPGSCR